MPARTRFFAISFAKALIEISRTFAVRSLNRSQESLYSMSANFSTFLEP